MLLWLTICIFIVSIAIAVWSNNDHYGDACNYISIIVAVIMSIVLLVMGLIVLTENIGLEGKIAACNARYESLVYQLENDIYENDNDLGKYELMSDIRAWNEDLAEYKANQDDFWVGVFIPNIFDQFEFIELE